VTTRGSASTAMTDVASDYTSGSAVHHSPKRAFRHWPGRFTSKNKLSNKTTKEKGKCKMPTSFSYWRVYCGLLLCAALSTGANLQNSGLQLLQTIPVPNWTLGKASTDLFGFNPVTRIMYLADRTNHAITVIDTHTNSVVGQMPLAPTTVVNQPLIAIDLQQLVVSDGVNSVLVWDLRTPLGTAPTIYPVPNVPDGMDYDTINQTVYVVNDNAPYNLTGISLTKNMIVSQTPIPFSADLIKFNPRDGKIYIAMEDADHNNASAGIAVFDPATNTMSAPAMYKVGSICPGHGIDIDPISNVAVMGCFQGTSNGNLGVDLATGKFIQFTDVGGTDSIVFNPNLRRFYSGSGLNTATTSGCPATLSGPPFGSLVPVVGVFDAQHPTKSAPARIDGVACTGRGNHIAGVDPITGDVYVPVSQFPADPTSNTTGIAGILLFHDTTRPAQDSGGGSATMLSGGGAASGTVRTRSDGGRRTLLTATITGVAGTSASLTVPTTVANELVHCTVTPNSASATCNDFLLGDPLIGSIMTLAVDQTAVARGTICGGKGNSCHADSGSGDDD